MKKVEVTTTIKEGVESNDDCDTASDLRPNQSIPILLEGERARWLLEQEYLPVGIVRCQVEKRLKICKCFYSRNCQKEEEWVQ